MSKEREHKTKAFKLRLFIVVIILILATPMITSPLLAAAKKSEDPLTIFDPFALERIRPSNEAARSITASTSTTASTEAIMPPRLFMISDRGAAGAPATVSRPWIRIPYRPPLLSPCKP
ncbi:MAG: hypothetical protein ACYSR3_14930 [Planctomycetota bacterium]